MLSITLRPRKKSTYLTAFKLRKLALALDRKADDVLQENYDMTLSQYVLLFGLAHYPESPQCQVARFLNLTQAAVSRQVDGLLEKRLIERSSNPENRREHLLKLTPRGHDLLDQAEALTESTYADTFASVSVSDYKTFAKVLDKLLTVSCQNTVSIQPLSRSER